MKTFLSICIFLISSSIFSIGQIPNRVKKVVSSSYNPDFPNNGFVIRNEKSYEYENRGNIQLEFEIEYYSTDSSFIAYGTFYEYNSSNQIQKNYMIGFP